MASVLLLMCPWFIVASETVIDRDACNQTSSVNVVNSIMPGQFAAIQVFRNKHTNYMHGFVRFQIS